MSTSTLDQFEDFIRQKVEKDHTTHAQISEELKIMFPEKRGLSVRSVMRFCAIITFRRLPGYHKMKWTMLLARLYSRYLDYSMWEIKLCYRRIHYYIWHTSNECLFRVASVTGTCSWVVTLSSIVQSMKQQ